MKSIEPSQEDTAWSSALRLKCDPLAFQQALLEVEISIVGNFYAVDFGPNVRPRQHRMGKNLVCTCYLGELCPAVDAVRAYLSSGGQPPPDPPLGYYPVIPSRCPICYAAVSYDRQLDTRERGAGWQCEIGGAAHYWQRMVQVLAWRFACKAASRRGLPLPEPPPADLW
jgi:hypothetical protein